MKKGKTFDYDEGEYTDDSCSVQGISLYDKDEATQTDGFLLDDTPPSKPIEVQTDPVEFSPPKKVSKPIEVQTEPVPNEKEEKEPKVTVLIVESDPFAK